MTPQLTSEHRPHMTRPRMTRPVLVTGAAGFIGGHTVRALLKDGHKVHASVRAPAALDPRAPQIIADLSTPGDAARALENCRAVIHAASGPPKAIVEGTRAVLDAAKDRKDMRVIYLSSVSVYGSGDGVFDEDAAPLGAVDAYGAAKQQAEALCRLAADAGQDVVILRPGIVTGSGSKLWVTDLAARIASGGATQYGARANGWSQPVHWQDLCRAIIAALNVARQPRAQVFNVSGAHQLSWNAYHARLAQALDLPQHKAGPAALSVSMLGKLTRKFGLPLGRPAPSLSELQVFRRRASFPSDRLTQSTGWRAQMTLDAIFAEIAAANAPHKSPPPKEPKI